MNTESLTQGKDVYHRLIDDIASGVLRPGDRLREVALAERLAVSRTPIREAIKDLEANGYEQIGLDHFAKKGDELVQWKKDKALKDRKADDGMMLAR